MSKAKQVVKPPTGGSPERQRSTTGTRLVSRGEYMRALSRKGLLWIKAVFFLLWGLGILLWAFLQSHTLFPNILLGGLASFAAVLSLLAAINAAERAQTMDPGVPCTRANTANLPTSNSLVRASEEPRPEQQTVLLRAVTHQETPPEQLLRSSDEPDTGGLVKS